MDSNRAGIIDKSVLMSYLVQQSQQALIEPRKAQIQRAVQSGLNNI